MLLLIETPDTTLAYDRDVKLPLYSGASIQEVRIVDLSGEVIERHNDPSPDGYRSLHRARRGEKIETSALPDPALTADDVPG